MQTIDAAIRATYINQFFAIIFGIGAFILLMMVDGLLWYLNLSLIIVNLGVFVYAFYIRKQLWMAQIKLLNSLSAPPEIK